MLSILQNGVLRRTGSSTRHQRVAVVTAIDVRFFSSKGSGTNNDGSKRFPSSGSKSGPTTFRPRRLPSKDYRPLAPRPARKVRRDPVTLEPREDVDVVLESYEDADDPLDAEVGPFAADAIRHTLRERAERGGEPLSAEEQLRMMDYFTAQPGSTEDLVGERRALALDSWDEMDRSSFMDALNDMIEEEQIRSLNLNDSDKDTDSDSDDDESDVDDNDDDSADEDDGSDDDDDGYLSDDLPNRNQLAHGVWGENIIALDRCQKVQRLGTVVSYRALMIAGNCNGCAAFGVGKGRDPQQATDMASRECRRNIFFVDRFQGSGLTRDLVGRQNSCKVYLRSVDPNRGLHGTPLVLEILKLMGIADCSAKTHGNRNAFNIVRATFKAFMTHESMEQIALKRGKRLMTFERAKRMQI